MPLFNVSEQEAQLLREVIAWFRSSKRNRPITPVDLQDQPAPEVYLARPPEAGLPRAERGQTGTGTIDLGDDVLGMAECEVYVRDPDTDKAKPAGFSQIVYNPFPEAFEQDDLIVIERDKFGDWYVAASQGGACVELVTGVQCSGGTLQVFTNFFRVPRCNP